MPKASTQSGPLFASQIGFPRRYPLPPAPSRPRDRQRIERAECGTDSSLGADLSGGSCAEPGRGCILIARAAPGPISIAVAGRRVDARSLVMAYVRMSVKGEERAPAGILERTANERFRDRWSAQLGWSAAMAVAAHAAVFAMAASLMLSYPDIQPKPTLEADRLLFLPFGEGSGPGDDPEPPAALIGELDLTEPQLDASEGSGISDVDADELWEALGERLRRKGATLLPKIAEPEAEPEPEAEVALADDTGTSDDEGDPEIGGTALTADLAELPEPDSLELDRLSALRPELAFMSASAWVLIRNQPEVEEFLRRGYRRGALDPESAGSVSVTLWIDRRGSVEWAEISKSSGHRDLDEFALALFNEVADFRAAREQGVYVSRSVTFSVNFPW